MMSTAQYAAPLVFFDEGDEVGWSDVHGAIQSFCAQPLANTSATKAHMALIGGDTPAVLDGPPEGSVQSIHYSIT